jgi:drug/metabolite transporter (DMT)-like permease
MGANAPLHATRHRHALGHVFACATCLVWGLTFVASKLLLNAGLSPFESLLLRYVIAYVALWVVRPRLLRFEGWRRELPYALCGISGVTLYYLFEYNSLLHTSANYTGIITGTAPLMVALAMWAVYRERPQKLFIVGFVVAITGITLVTAGGGTGLDISLLGALLAFGGTLCWAAYCVFLRKLNPGNSAEGVRGSPASAPAPAPASGSSASAPAPASASGSSASAPAQSPQPSPVDPVLAARRMFFWALVSMVPCVPFLGFDVGDVNLLAVDVAVPLLLLGILASALCYILYNLATAWIGAVKTSAYIYFTPVVNVVGAYIILGETVQLPGILGIAIIITGLILSERGS